MRGKPGHSWRTESGPGWCLLQMTHMKLTVLMESRGECPGNHWVAPIPTIKVSTVRLQTGETVLHHNEGEGQLVVISGVWLCFIYQQSLQTNPIDIPELPNMVCRMCRTPGSLPYPPDPAVIKY